MSLLSVIQTALQELNQPAPSAVVASTDPNVMLCLALANRTAKELVKHVGDGDYWSQIREQFLFNMLGIGPFTATFTKGSPNITGITGTNLAGVLKNWQVSSQFALNDTMVVSVNSGAGSAVMSQPATGGGQDTQLAFGQEAYPLPADLDHFIPQTGWDRNFRWQLLGPIDAQEWQVLKSGISPVGPRLRYRLMGGFIYLNPAPYVPTGQSSPIADLIVMEYASKNWATQGFAITAIAPGATTGVTYTSSASANPLNVGDEATFSAVGGMQELNGLKGAVTALGGASPNYTATVAINSTQFEAFTSGGLLADITNNTKSSYQADSDVACIPEDLIIQGLKWRWLRANGFNYAEEISEFEDNLALIFGNEQMARALPLNARASGIRLLSSQNVPDTGFGS